MKKKFLPAAAIILAGSFLLSSCIGSFALSNKLLAWNQTIDNKFVNEIIFVVLTPAYAVTMTVDALVLNSIEFWSGENPAEAGVVKTIQGKDGIYTVETLENGYDVKNENGENMQFVYDKRTNTWSLVENDNTTKLLKYVDDKNAIVYLPNGQEQVVELSSYGVLALRQTVQNMYLAQR